MALLQIFISTTKNKQIISCIFKKCFHLSTNLLEKGENVRKALIVPYTKEKPINRRKVTIVGAAGKTGVSMGYTLLAQNYCDEVIMFDTEEHKEKLCGEALDFLHGTSLHKCPKMQICMDMKNTKDSDLIILNSGIPITEEESGADIAQANICHFKEIVPCLAQLSPESVMLVNTNPTDIMTYTAWKYSCFDKNRIIGTGTEIDSARFRYHIGQRLGINSVNIGGWIIGEHGDSSVPVWSSINVAGTKLRDIDPAIGTCGDENCWDELHKEVVKDGLMVSSMKGCIQYAIAQAADNIAKAVLSDAKTVHAVSTQIKGLYGVQTKCFMSMPCVIGNKGVSHIVKLVLDDDESEKLNNSACSLDGLLKKCKFP